MSRQSVAVGGMVLALLAWGYAAAQEAPAADPPAHRWPMQVQTADSTITVYQPQLESFEGDQLSGRAAVSVMKNGQQEPIFGAAWIQSRVDVDRVARTVRVLDVTVTRTRVPGIDAATEQTLDGAIRQIMTSQPITLSLDQLLAMLQTIQTEQAKAADIANTPPKIVFLEHPGMLVQYDGAPRLVQVANSPLMRVINTPFLVVLDGKSKTYYLRGAGQWFAAADALGPFKDAGAVPAGVEALAESEGYKDPQQPLSAEVLASLEIVTATEPTELICTDGEPQMGPIPGTDLLYVTNTDSDVFLLMGTQEMYVLLSGRWYEAPNRSGPWTFVPPDQLPADFSRIPANFVRADVLASVPGTMAAQDAVANADVPQTAAVDLHQFDQPPVEYDGDPDFQPIEGTSLAYAVNTPAAVIRAGGSYYCCSNAVWYLGTSPVGPWGVCTAVPAEIYTIGPSCPIYPVRYVYVYGHTADVAYVGYTPGYVGCYVWDGVVVYGTGCLYQPWLGHMYFPRPCTFGFAARYNSYAGTWGFGFATSLGGGSAWIGRAPGLLGRGGARFGFGGYRSVHRRDDIQLRQTPEEYRGREATIAGVRHDAYARNLYDRRTDVHREEAARAIAGHEPEVGAGPRNDVLADRDGEAYRKTVDGWEKRDNASKQWAPLPREAARVEEHAVAPAEEHVAPHADEHTAPPAEEHRPAPPEDHAAAAPQQHTGPVSADLNREYKARVVGEQRSNSYERPSAPARPAPPPPAPAGHSDGAENSKHR